MSWLSYRILTRHGRHVVDENYDPATTTDSWWQGLRSRILTDVLEKGISDLSLLVSIEGTTTIFRQEIAGLRELLEKARRHCPVNHLVVVMSPFFYITEETVDAISMWLREMRRASVSCVVQVDYRPGDEKADERLVAACERAEKYRRVLQMLRTPQPWRAYFPRVSYRKILLRPQETLFQRVMDRATGDITTDVETDHHNVIGVIDREQPTHQEEAAEAIYAEHVDANIFFLGLNAPQLDGLETFCAGKGFHPPLSLRGQLELLHFVSVLNGFQPISRRDSDFLAQKVPSLSFGDRCLPRYDSYLAPILLTMASWATSSFALRQALPKWSSLYVNPVVTERTLDNILEVIEKDAASVVTKRIWIHVGECSGENLVLAGQRQRSTDDLILSLSRRPGQMGGRASHGLSLVVFYAEGSIHAARRAARLGSSLALGFREAPHDGDDIARVGWLVEMVLHGRSQEEILSSFSSDEGRLDSSATLFFSE